MTAGSGRGRSNRKIRELHWRFDDLLVFDSGYMYLVDIKHRIEFTTWLQDSETILVSFSYQIFQMGKTLSKKT